MQFDSLRAFPYPVLRPDVDDYVDGELQVTADFQVNDTEITVGVTCALSVADIRQLIEIGRARYVVVFACRDTYFRHAEMSKEPSFAVKFRGGDLRGEVIVNPYVVAVEPIAGYRSKLLNSEFGAGPFDFDEGSILAMDRPQAIYVDREVYRPISSVFTLVRNENLSTHEWRVDLMNDYVQLQVSTPMKEKIDRARNSSSNRAILLNSLYFSAVMQCISALKGSDQHEDLKWARIIRHKCHNMGIDLDAHDEYVVAQRIMKQPLAALDRLVFDGAAHD
ncbi:MAG: hypothetical protein EOS10_11650 [Mesorhizobium sp.]|uniref:hypothetical protein n=1 Tax=Mesorhizobium sp. TaxID=1871066 RepID=UPI000FE7A5B4|nr:hypothetical protein [Mesorhizobium sp.]RWO32346.1 MAG: hypothetical protein EOS10_11650 [Mesorhizobium sp.]